MSCQMEHAYQLYSTCLPSFDEDPIQNTVSFNQLNYALPHVVELDSKLFFKELASPKSFESYGHPYSFWHPSKDVVDSDAWLEEHLTHGSGLNPKEKSHLLDLASHCLLVSSFKEKNLNMIKEAFIGISEQLNAGCIEKLRPCLSHSLYKHLSGWKTYMDDHHCTWKLKVNKINRVQILGSNTFMKFGPTVHQDGIALSPHIGQVQIKPRLFIFVEPKTSKPKHAKTYLKELNILSWVKFNVDEEFQIFDQHNQLIYNSPTINEHVWKFSMSYDDPIPLINANQLDRNGFIMNLENWSKRHFVKVCDWNHQVAIRAWQILSLEKLFLSPNEPRRNVWELVTTS